MLLKKNMLARRPVGPHNATLGMCYPIHSKAQGIVTVVTARVKPDPNELVGSVRSHELSVSSWFQSNNRQIPHRENLILTLLFAMLIAGIMTGSIANWWTVKANTVLPEQRLVSPKPKLSFKKPTEIETFQHDFQNFFNDRLYGRGSWIAALSYTRYRFLQTTDSKLVLVGKNGWLFYRPTGGEIVARNAPLFTDAEVDDFAKALETRREWLAMHGIKYVVYVVPNPSTIYPEELPDRFRVKNRTSRMDQLISAVRRSTRVNFVDLRPDLLKAKSESLIYYKTDTHWNSHGAFVGAKPLVEALHKLFPVLPPLRDDELKLVPFHFGDGDLGHQIGLHDLIPEETVQQDPKASRPWRLSDDYKDSTFKDQVVWRKPFATVIDRSQLPRAVCLRDSYMVAQQTFLSTRFSRITYLWTAGFPMSDILREKPDVVIQEIAERFLAVPNYLFDRTETYQAIRLESSPPPGSL